MANHHGPEPLPLTRAARNLKRLRSELEAYEWNGAFAFAAEVEALRDLLEALQQAAEAED